jgi:hypothetical protein
MTVRWQRRTFRWRIDGAACRARCSPYGAGDPEASAAPAKILVVLVEHVSLVIMIGHGDGFAAIPAAARQARDSSG